MVIILRLRISLELQSKSSGVPNFSDLSCSLQFLPPFLDLARSLIKHHFPSWRVRRYSHTVLVCRYYQYLVWYCLDIYTVIIASVSVSCCCESSSIASTFLTFFTTFPGNYFKLIYLISHFHFDFDSCWSHQFSLNLTSGPLLVAMDTSVSDEAGTLLLPLLLVQTHDICWTHFLGSDDN